MRKYVSFIIVLMCFGIFGTLESPAKRIGLTINNIDSISEPNSFFVINTSINIKGKILTVGANSVLQFRAGWFIDGELNINGAMVDAAPYCIFFGTKVNGPFGNEEVQAKWFTNLADVSEVVNRAFEFAPTNRIRLSGPSNYMPNGSDNIIRFNQPGLRLKAYGKLGFNSSDQTFIELSAPDLGLYLRNVKRSGEPLRNNIVVHLYGNVQNSRIEIQEIGTGGKAFAFMPKEGEGDNQKVWNNKFRFAHVNTLTDAMYFKDASSATAKLTVKGNYFDGGRLSGQSAVWQENAYTPETYPYHANVYYGLIFERVDDVCVRMRGSDNETYKYARMNEQLPLNGKPFLDISGSRYSRIETKGYTNSGKEIYAGANVNNVDIRVFTNTGKYFAITNVSRAIVTSPTADATGASCVYLTSVEMPYCKQAKTLDYAASSVAQTDAIEVKDLFDTLTSSSDTTCIFNDLCVMNIGANRTISLTEPSSFMTTIIPLTLVVNLQGTGSKLVYKGFEYKASGTYRIVWRPNWEVTIERIYQ